ncbi:MAG: WYL domain-containing protein [Cryomorphaceae bacterium]|jgi:predicted DNA-binding transcriptional regulator YafY|nr:WYL domain-containing protein [Cryomorphaceae bacterium]
MPINKNALGRYKVIDMLLRNTMRPYPSMDDILEACREKLGIDPSVETIQKDINRMKMDPPDGFSAPIEYNRYHKGYEYLDPNYSISGIPLSENDIDAIKESIDLIRNIGGSRMSQKFNSAMEKILTTVLEEFPQGDFNRQILHTMSPPHSRGFEHFDLFYRACREKRPVSFVHYSYRKRTFSPITIHPCMIKEFDNKWYITGYSEKHKTLRTFGLDRVLDPFILKKPFISPDPKALDVYMHDYYGVYPIPDQKKQKITIEVSALVTEYFQAYPIHESQKIKKDPDGYSLITFQLIPTIELTRLFLSYGHHVQVVEPEWLIRYTKKLK